MKKFVLAAIAAFFLIASPAAAVPAAPTGVSGSCGDPHLLWWNSQAGTHTHTIYRSMRAHPAQPYNVSTSFADQVGSDAWFGEPPQAQSVRYTVTTTDATGESAPSAAFQCDSDIKWIAGAETTPTYSSGTTNYGEWADDSLVNGTKAISSSTVLKGFKSYQCSILVENSSEERCESVQGNASAVNMSLNKLYENNATLWIAYGVYIPSSYSYCGTQCSKDYDGGAITQEKQLGACGNPVLSMATFNNPADGSRTITQHNSVENYCVGSSPADADILWKIPIQPDRWIKVIRRIHFSTDSTQGWIEAFYDNDGNASNNWTPVTTSNFTSAGLAKTHASSVTELGTTERLYTHTQKTGAGTSDSVCDDSPAVGNWPCTHQRAGIYRNPLITGSSTLWHDGVAAGPTAAGVIQAAF